MTFQRDKLGHLGVGLGIALLTDAVTQSLGLTWGAVVLAATGKEALDATGRGHVEFRDWLATILPAGVPTIYHLNEAAILAALGL